MAGNGNMLNMYQQYQEQSLKALREMRIVIENVITNLRMEVFIQMVMNS